MFSLSAECAGISKVFMVLYIFFFTFHHKSERQYREKRMHSKSEDHNFCTQPLLAGKH